jgi:hypothetical protein
MFGFFDRGRRKPARITADTPPSARAAVPAVHARRGHTPRATPLDVDRTRSAADAAPADGRKQRGTPPERIAALAGLLADYLRPYLHDWQEGLTARVEEVVRTQDTPGRQCADLLTEQVNAANAAQIEALSRQLEQRLVGRIDEQAVKVTDAITEKVNQRWSAHEQRVLEACATTAQRATQRPIIDAVMALHDRVCQETQFQSLWYHKDPELAGHLGCRQLQERWESAARSYAAEILRILHSLDVEPIVSGGGQFNPHHQRVVNVEPTAQPELDGHIARIVRPGFTWHRQILRPEEVIVYKKERRPHEKAH